MSTLERAVEIATEAHRGQTDKSGEPYILHPLELLSRMENDTERKAAVLHDVVEDSDWTLNDLRCEGFSEEMVDAVEHLTKAKYLDDDELETVEKDYDEFIERVKKNEIARKVKQADIEHNMDLTRLDDPTQEDLERLMRYHRSWKKLNS
jgi:(p)ppGpp synthase/HD superfamily hydrolase